MGKVNFKEYDKVEVKQIVWLVAEIFLLIVMILSTMMLIVSCNFGWGFLAGAAIIAALLLKDIPIGDEYLELELEDLEEDF